MKTLAEMNASPSRHEWSGLTLETTYEVGGMGRSWSAYHSGAKFHILIVETIVGVPEGYTGPSRVGKVFSSRASCNGNGQWTGIRAPHLKLDTDRVNCRNCGGGR